MPTSSSGKEPITESEMRYRALVDLSPDAVLVTTGGEVSYANSAAAAMWGAHMPNELVGNTYSELVRADFQELLAERQLAKGLEDADSQQSDLELGFGDRNDSRPIPAVEIVIQTFNGKEKRIESSGVVLTFDGELSVMYSVRDITQRTEIQDALKQSESNVQAFVRAIPDLMFRVNRQGEMLDAKAPNDVELIEVSGDRIGRSLHELMPKELADSWLSSIEQALETHTVQMLHYELDIRGATRVREARVVANGLDEVLVISRDVTEQKRAEDALKRSEARSRKLADDMAAVAEIGRVINSSLEIDEVYDRFCECLANVLSFDWVSVNWIDSVSGVVTMAYHGGSRPFRLEPGYQFEIKGSFSGEVVDALGGLVFPREIPEASANRNPSLEAGARSVMGVPLVHRNTVVGVLIIGSSHDALYTQEDLEMAGIVGSQIIGAMANSRLYAESVDSSERI